MKILKTLIILMVLLTIITLVACKDQLLGTSDDNKTVTTLVETTLLVKDDVIREHQLPAVFLAVNRADLSFQLSGTIDHVWVKVGETVEQGQVLMSLYNPNIDPAVESNLAQLESIKAKIVQVKRDVENLKQLRKNNSTSKTAYEHKQTDLKDLLAQQKSIKAQIDLALANQSESMIKAPYDGVITAVNKQQSEFVAAGQVVMTINQPSQLEVEAYVTANLWKSLQLGQKISADFQGHSIDFSVTELAQVADVHSHLFKVILQLDSVLENAIGQQVMLNFPENYPDVYRLPLEVVVDDGINQPYIFLSVNSQAQKMPIEALFIQAGHVIFKTPKPINNAVIIKGQSKIAAGMQLQVTP
jgi:RND family efflux transporter MFP subunit